MFQKPLQKGEFSSGVVITFQVMAVTRVSPGNPHSVRPMAEGGKNELGAHTAGARNPDDPEVMGVLETAHPGQVCCPVTAPVAEEGGYLWLPVIH